MLRLQLTSPQRVQTVHHLHERVETAAEWRSFVGDLLSGALDLPPGPPVARGVRLDEPRNNSIADLRRTSVAPALVSAAKTVVQPAPLGAAPMLTEQPPAGTDVRRRRHRRGRRLDEQQAHQLIEKHKKFAKAVEIFDPMHAAASAAALQRQCAGRVGYRTYAEHAAAMEQGLGDLKSVVTAMELATEAQPAEFTTFSVLAQPVELNSAAISECLASMSTGLETQAQLAYLELSRDPDADEAILLDPTEGFQVDRDIGEESSEEEEDYDAVELYNRRKEQEAAGNHNKDSETEKKEKSAVPARRVSLRAQQEEAAVSAMVLAKAQERINFLLARFHESKEQLHEQQKEGLERYQDAITALNTVLLDNSELNFMLREALEEAARRQGTLTAERTREQLVAYLQPSGLTPDQMEDFRRLRESRAIALALASPAVPPAPLQPREEGPSPGSRSARSVRSDSSDKEPVQPLPLEPQLLSRKPSLAMLTARGRVREGDLPSVRAGERKSQSLRISVPNRNSLPPRNESQQQLTHTGQPAPHPEHQSPQPVIEPPTPLKTMQPKSPMQLDKGVEPVGHLPKPVPAQVTSVSAILAAEPVSPEVPGTDDRTARQRDLLRLTHNVNKFVYRLRPFGERDTENQAEGIPPKRADTLLRLATSNRGDLLDMKRPSPLGGFGGGLGGLGGRDFGAAVASPSTERAEALARLREMGVTGGTNNSPAVAANMMAGMAPWDKRLLADPETPLLGRRESFSPYRFPPPMSQQQQHQLQFQHAQALAQAALASLPTTAQSPGVPSVQSAGSTPLLPPKQPGLTAADLALQAQLFAAASRSSLPTMASPDGSAPVTASQSPSQSPLLAPATAPINEVLPEAAKDKGKNETKRGKGKSKGKKSTPPKAIPVAATTGAAKQKPPAEKPKSDPKSKTTKEITTEPTKTVKQRRNPRADVTRRKSTAASIGAVPTETEQAKPDLQKETVPEIGVTSPSHPPVMLPERSSVENLLWSDDNPLVVSRRSSDVTPYSGSPLLPPQVSNKEQADSSEEKAEDAQEIIDWPEDWPEEEVEILDDGTAVVKGSPLSPHLNTSWPTAERKPSILKPHRTQQDLENNEEQPAEASGMAQHARAASGKRKSVVVIEPFILPTPNIPRAPEPLHHGEREVAIQQDVSPVPTFPAVHVHLQPTQPNILHTTATTAANTQYSATTAEPEPNPLSTEAAQIVHSEMLQKIAPTSHSATVALETAIQHNPTHADSKPDSDALLFSNKVVPHEERNPAVTNSPGIVRDLAKEEKEADLPILSSEGQQFHARHSIQGVAIGTASSGRIHRAEPSLNSQVQVSGKSLAHSLKSSVTNETNQETDQQPTTEFDRGHNISSMQTALRTMELPLATSMLQYVRVADATQQQLASTHSSLTTEYSKAVTSASSKTAVTPTQAELTGQAQSETTESKLRDALESKYQAAGTHVVPAETKTVHIAQTELSRGELDDGHIALPSPLRTPSSTGTGTGTGTGSPSWSRQSNRAPLVPQKQRQPAPVPDTAQSKSGLTTTEGNDTRRTAPSHASMGTPTALRSPTPQSRPGTSTEAVFAPPIADTRTVLQSRGHATTDRLHSPILSHAKLWEEKPSFSLAQKGPSPPPSPPPLPPPENSDQQEPTEQADESHDFEAPSLQQSSVAVSNLSLPAQRPAEDLFGIHVGTARETSSPSVLKKHSVSSLGASEKVESSPTRWRGATRQSPIATKPAVHQKAVQKRSPVRTQGSPSKALPARTTAMQEPDGFKAPHPGLPTSESIERIVNAVNASVAAATGPTLRKAPAAGGFLRHTVVPVGQKASPVAHQDNSVQRRTSLGMQGMAANSFSAALATSLSGTLAFPSGSTLRVQQQQQPQHPTMNTLPQFAPTTLLPASPQRTVQRSKHRVALPSISDGLPPLPGGPLGLAQSYPQPGKRASPPPGRHSTNHSSKRTLTPDESGLPSLQAAGRGGMSTLTAMRATWDPAAWAGLATHFPRVKGKPSGPVQRKFTVKPAFEDGPFPAVVIRPAPTAAHLARRPA